MDRTELERIIEAILFAAGEPVEASRLAMAAECDPDEVETAAKTLMDRLAFERRGIRVVRLENAYQMCSSTEMSGYITKALETRKPPKLSASQLETLTIIAYYQPATKAYVEQIRGVDSSYSDDGGFPAHLRPGIPGRAARDRKNAVRQKGTACQRNTRNDGNGGNRT